MQIHGTDQSEFELDLGSFGAALWQSKAILFAAFFLSIPCALYFIKTQTPTYISETIIEITQESNEGSQSFGSTSSLGLALGLNLPKSRSKLIPLMMGGDFLKAVLKSNDFVNKELQKSCSYSPPSRYSVANILDKINIMAITEPNESQKINFIVECMRRMISITDYEHKSKVTSANSIMVTTSDPFFSAELANALVTQYFIEEKYQREVKFQSTIKFLSDTIAQARLELSSAQAELRDFTIKISALIDVTPSFEGNETVSLRNNIKEKINELGQTKIRFQELDNTLSGLKSLVKKSIRKVDLFIQRIGLEGGLSRTFLAEISKALIENKSSINDKEIEFALNREIKRLEELLIKNSLKIKKKEKEAEKLIKIEKELSELELSVEEKLIYFQNLKDQLTKKSVEAGVSMLQENVLYSKAVAPLSPSSPKKRRVLVGFAIFFTFIATLFVLIRQSTTKKVFRISQISKHLPPKYTSELTWQSDFKNQIPFANNFLRRLLNAGKIGAIIDLSENNDTRVSEEFAALLGRILSGEEKKVLCLTNQTDEKNIFIRSKNQKPSFSESGRDVSKETNQVTFLEDTERQLEKGEIFNIRKIIEPYDHVLLPLGNNVDDLARFKLTEQCDFFILIGMSGKFKLKKFLKYSAGITDESSKCIGSFLLT